MFVKHIIKTLHVSVTIVWPSSGARFPCLVLLLLLCLFASSSCLFGMWLYVVHVCVWVTDALVCGRFGCEQFRTKRDVLVCGRFGCEQFTTNFPQTSASATHTHRQHSATYQINNSTTQTSREVVTALSTENGPPEDGQTVVTETCGGLNDVFYKHF